MKTFFNLAILLQLLCSFAHSFDLFPFEKTQLSPSNLPKEPSLLSSTPHPSPPLNTTCKVFPGDASWPTDSQWALLNRTVNGALIKTIPLASPCYPGPLANADRCSYLTSQWGNSSLHMNDPTSPMSPLWYGLTCEPPSLFPSPSQTCTLGGLPSYSINATTVSHIQAGINFARNSGIRLVIKNTGHDFSGKSCGAGSLSIWTHWLKDIAFTPSYNDDGYEGPAFKAGTGVQAWEIYEEAEKEGVVVVGGEGRTVGIFGGYILGGGHSPLSSIYGIAADNILSISLVLPSGLFTTVSRTSNPSLFWALKGGGGSTFGIITSVTIKAHPSLPVTTTSIIFPPTISYEQFWAGVRSYFTHFPTFTKAGTYGYFRVFPTGVGLTPIFSLNPFFAPNLSVSETKTLLSPWLRELEAIGINLNLTYNHYDTFLPAWKASFPQEGVGRESGYFGSRLFPLENFKDGNSTLFNDTFEAWKGSVDAGFAMISFQIRAPLFPRNEENAVNPAWRKTVLHSIQSVGWNSTGNQTEGEIAARKLLTERMEKWKGVSPGAGAYLGESDRGEEGWQESFYGDVYGELERVKWMVDPEMVFWAKTAVGSEGWDVRSQDIVGNEDGRLCRV